MPRDCEADTAIRCSSYEPGRGGTCRRIGAGFIPFRPSPRRGARKSVSDCRVPRTPAAGRRFHPLWVGPDVSRPWQSPSCSPRWGQGPSALWRTADAPRVLRRGCFPHVPRSGLPPVMAKRRAFPLCLLIGRGPSIPLPRRTGAMASRGGRSCYACGDTGAAGPMKPPARPRMGPCTARGADRSI